MSLIVKSYACAIRKERIEGKIPDNYLLEFIHETKSSIKDNNYSKSIKNIKVIYYVLMTKLKVKKNFENEKIDFSSLDKDELINEKIKIERELGRRNGEGSEFFKNFVLSSELGIITGVISGCLFNQYSLYAIIAGWVFLFIIGIFLIVTPIKKRKELLYSLCLDAVNELIDMKI